MFISGRNKGRRSRLRPLFGVLLLIAASCGSADDDAAELAAPAPEGAEYGDTIDEFFAATDGADGSETLDALAATDTADAAGSGSSEPPPGYREIQWEDLVPPGSSDEEISARFDEKIAAVEPGTPEADAVYAELQAEFDNQPVNPEAAGEAIQLAGFVAPLSYTGELITEFLLVPYFGACIHVPPPPPNQTVMVTLAEGQGLTIADSYGAVWVTGTLTIDGAETDLATAGYSISGAQTGVYDEF